MKSILMVLMMAAVVSGAVVATAHEGHKHSKAGAAAAGSSSTAGAKSATPVAVKPGIPAAKPLPAASVADVNLTGELIDPQCWFTHNGEGESHAKCAVICAKGGQDLAFLDSGTGEIYTLIATSHGSNPNDGMYEHVGVPVRVRGTAYQRGTNRGLLVESVARIK